MISINFRDSRPIYEQVKDSLRRLIVSGALSPDEKLPSVRELASQLVINPNTIQRAYRELEHEGYIVSVPGKGSFARQADGADSARRAELLGAFDDAVEELMYLGVTAEVVKRFGAHRALDGLSMTVPSGAVYGLVGPNGAGKTTAIRHIAGILRPDGGEVLADGVPVFENVDAKARMAYIPDEVFYFPQASVNDMMHFYRGVYPGFDSERFERLAEAFPIDRKMPMRRFSRGMKKQAAFWLALSLRPELLVLDEPVDGLDPVMRRQVWSLLLSDVAEHGTGVLVSSHNLRELEDVCDMVGFINNGKMLLERQLSELQENICKIQLVMPDGRDIPDGLDVLHVSGPGKLKTLIVRGAPEAVTARLERAGPLFVDAVPLTLEEIFIYELGGEGREVRDIVL